MNKDILNQIEEKYILYPDGSIYSKTKKLFLKPYTDNHGYKRIKLINNKETKHYRIHRLIAMKYLPEIENKLQINHKNGIKTDNRVENLEWCDFIENITHAINAGLLNTLKPIIKLDLNGNILNTYRSIREAEKELNLPLCRSKIRYCCSGKRKTAYSFKWKYLK